MTERTKSWIQGAELSFLVGWSGIALETGKQLRHPQGALSRSADLSYQINSADVVQALY